MATAVGDRRQTDTFRELVAAEIRAHLARRRISNRRLAAMLGATPAWVDRRLNGTTAVDTDDLEKIAQALGMTPMDLLAGIPFQSGAPAANPRRRINRGWTGTPGQLAA
jgi:transcriptional regulator with XRE-family HTH domain